MRFKNQEESYVTWLKQNTNSYVFNHFGGSNPRYNKLHRAACYYLNRTRDNGVRTKYEKLCSASLQEIEIEANRLRGADGWTYCGNCFNRR